ncbi:hypothetical protein LXL04_020405 [Taraxacum kok-saghyz]
MALILKCKWRFFNNPTSLWTRLIKEFYGSNGGFFQDRKPAAGSRPWSRILAVEVKFHVTSLVSKSTLRRSVGNGEETRFWEDVWIGHRTQATLFPRLAVLEATPVDGWRWCWQRQVRDGRPAAELSRLLELLTSFSCSDHRDKCVWELSEEGTFSVAETRRWIDNDILPEGSGTTRWCRLVPRKVNIFIWCLLLDRIPSFIALSTRGIEINSIMCPVCQDYPGHVGHLFGSCDVAVRIWDAVARWLQIPSFAYLTPREVFARVDGSRINAKQKEVLEVVVCTVFWVIWQYRNDVVHDAGKLEKRPFLWY